MLKKIKLTKHQQSDQASLRLLRRRTRGCFGTLSWWLFWFVRGLKLDVKVQGSFDVTSAVGELEVRVRSQRS